MVTQWFKSGSLALALLWMSVAAQPLFAQHHHGGGHYGGSSHHGSYGGGSHHHHHSGSGIYIGSGGFGLGYGSGYGGYGGYGGYNSLRYSSGYGSSLYGNGYYNSYPSYGYGGTSVYVTPRYVTPQYVTPQYVTPRYVTSTPVYSTPSVVYRSPSVQSTSRIDIPPQNSVQQSNLPGVTFGSRAHIPELARAVADRTNQLCIALSDSYRGSPQFNEVYRDTYSLIARAQQLAQPNSAADASTLLASLSDMNAILAQAAPVIDGWQPQGGGTASATSHLSSVQSALKLLSIDAGWDASQAASRPAASTATPFAVPDAPPIRVAPAPDSLPTEGTPTPVDPVPAP